MSHQDDPLTEPSGMSGASGDIEAGAESVDDQDASGEDPNPSGLPDPAEREVPTEGAGGDPSQE